MPAVRTVVVAEHGRGSMNRHAGGIERNEDHGVPGVPLGVRVRYAHHDRDCALATHGTGRPPLAAVDQVVAAVAGDRGRDVGGIRGCDVRLGHGEARPDLALQQGFEPLIVLLVGAEHGE